MLKICPPPPEPPDILRIMKIHKAPSKITGNNNEIISPHMLSGSFSYSEILPAALAFVRLS